MYNSRTQKTFSTADDGARFDGSLRSMFDAASEGGALDIAWDSMGTTARIDMQIGKIRNALALTMLFELLGGDTEIQRAA